MYEILDSSLHLGLDSTGGNNVLELGLEGSTTDKKSVNVGLLNKLLAVASLDTTSVDNTNSSGSLLSDLSLEVLTDLLVSLLCLLRGRGDTSANGPNRLVRHHHAVNGALRHSSNDRLKLLLAHLHGAASLAVLQLLTDARNHAHAAFERHLRLGTYNFSSLATICPTLAVAQNAPVKTEILYDVYSELASPRAGGRLAPNVLDGHGHVLAQVGLDGVNVESGGSDDNFGVGGEFTSTVKKVHELRHGLLGAVAFPVATDEDLLAAHLEKLIGCLLFSRRSKAADCAQRGVRRSLKERVADRQSKSQRFTWRKQLRVC
mmetsp:Transcript_1204/g.2905  ORF Transcript_1204/g.2905 Transcript_1204/m.2905 type:complete len:318 (+) Transcript_1204:125-1078(+)